jgi:hypothetical protein
MDGAIWWASRARQVPARASALAGGRAPRTPSNLCLVCSRQIARGILESVLVVGGQSVELVPINFPLENYDAILPTLFDIDPEVVVLAVTFPDELGIMRTRQHWPSTVQVVAAVAAGVGAFSTDLAQTADGVLGPSQWEPGVTFPNIAGPTSDWFLDSFQRQFGETPDYIAAGSFATGLVLTECIRLAASLDDEKLRSTVSDLECNTFYARFRIDSRTGIQNGTPRVAHPLARRLQSSAAVAI